jgi:lysozyme
MSGIVPGSTPQMGNLEVNNILGGHGITERCAILAVRKYYQDSFGKKGANDIAVYDDALFLRGPTFFGAFNANVDPGAYRKGHGTGSSKGMAQLKPGTYRVHKLDIHNGKYLALCQRAGDVTVYRDADSSVPESKIKIVDGRRVYEDTGAFGINVHHGTKTTTSSAGCQTIWPSQWEYFIEKVQEQMKLSGQKIMPYCLIDGV